MGKTGDVIRIGTDETVIAENNNADLIGPDPFPCSLASANKRLGSLLSTSVSAYGEYATRYRIARCNFLFIFC
jgi:hypothetical protein